jgi:hypothetical protein
MGKSNNLNTMMSALKQQKQAAHKAAANAAKAAKKAATQNASVQNVAKKASVGDILSAL